MSAAEELREAARLMRANAGKAAEGPWTVSSQYGRVDIFQYPYNPGDEMVVVEVDAYDAEHIASWHPAVALAVADWLEQHAEQHGSAGRDECRYHDDSCGALLTARTYLGTT